MKSFKLFFILSEAKKLKQYIIQIPPNTKKECIEIMKKVPSITKGPWMKNVNNKEVQQTFKQAVKDMDIETARHETLHALQELNIPEIFKDLPVLTHQFDSTEEYKKKHYYNRPPEIMAYAYDTVMGVNSQENQRIYKEINGKVNELFQHYVQEYKHYLK